MMVLQDGKIAKLRAACDACNESKVRCSQTKPKCGRCVRQGVPCVYGLSRRSHKSAPRVGASNSRTSTPEQFMTNFNSPLLPTSTDTSSAPNAVPVSEPGVVAPHALSTSDQSSRVEAPLQDRLVPQENADAAAQNRAFMPSTIDGLPAIDTYIRLLTDSSEFDITGSFEPLFNLGSDTLVPKNDFVSQFGPESGSVSSAAGPTASRDDGASPRLAVEARKPGSISCNCNQLAVKELLSMPFSAQEQTTYLDVTFSRLKQAIRIAEECVSCVCTTRDEMSIITSSTLIGRIIEGFEIFMEKANSLNSFSGIASVASSEKSSPSSVEPTLSWGVLQIEPDEEAELRQHMWLIQLRKLQRVIKKLGVAVSFLRNVQDSGNSAHIISCQCIHMWLMQKAEVLHGRHLSTDGPAGSTEAAV
ncbi:hypothetical protein F4861DRAFT_223330 [Xylaria intraflava]|nr:hypothetical protein F4861DRAFT_223330 [Xylaria intraflava]